MVMPNGSPYVNTPTVKDQVNALLAQGRLQEAQILLLNELNNSLATAPTNATTQVRNVGGRSVTSTGSPNVPKTEVPVIQGYPSNAPTIQVATVALPSITASTTGAQRFPDMVVHNGMALLIKAAPSNLGIVYIASSMASALNINSAYPLLPNETLSIYVTTPFGLWGSAINAGDFVYLLIEH